MTVRVDVKPELLRWACERSGLDVAALTGRFPHLEAWTRGEVKPTLKQLESLAKATHTPAGYLFLPEPPVERLPIPDFRTVSAPQRQRPSPELLDTIYAMQQRQGWLREYLIEDEAETLAFVGSARLSDPPESVGAEMRRVVGIEDGWASSVATWQQAVSDLRRRIEALGVMAVINGVVGNNTHRPLDVAEFRGFALNDPYAPLIFVNGADAKSAQMFTLAHELAHLWLGAPGLSGFEGLFPRGTDVEEWCNQAAAEFLVPARTLEAEWPEVRRSKAAFEALARTFKVSPIVVARRALDLRLIARTTFFAFYDAYIKQEHRRKPRAGGGDFYNNQNTRVGELLAAHVMRAAAEGRVGFKEAYDLVGLRGGAFREYASRLGVRL
ncbi:MAG: ImmA/IrrE family metallo-endopeptidase [Deltaproteobacteria bacterium]|nr:ImmA/IrrE family metallo-endopeptidase [Deltaproteobacteria bacterium]